MANDATLIVGHLSDAELRASIDRLVNDVNDKFIVAAGTADASIEAMEKAMRRFGNTTKSVITDIKDMFKQMGTTFDDFAKAMERAAAAAKGISSGASSGSGRGGGTGSGTGSGTGNPPDPDTIAGLKAEIAELQKLLDLQQQHSRELQNQVNILALQKKSLKEQTTDSFTKEWKDAFSFPARQINDARTKLQKLKDIASNYKATGFMSPDLWNKLQNEIQKTEEKIKKLEKAAARVGSGTRRSGRTGVALPQNFTDVLAMSEKGVDAIALKMKALRGLKIDPTNKDEVKKLADEYQRLKKLRAEFIGQSDFVIRQNSALARSFNYIRNRLVYALSVGAITNFAKQIYEVRGQYELLERSLGVLVGSFQRGSQIFQELSDMAIKSPFTLVELGSAAKQLTAYNFAANEVVDVTRRLADMSAALGVPMERLTYNLGQIRAQTVLTARDARDFANAGLPIVKTLADYYSELEGRVVSTGDVYDRMSKKMVSFTDVMAVLNQMTDEGGKFFDFQAKQAETLKVQMANLTLAWNNMLNEIGEKNQSTLEMPLQTLKTLLLHWKGVEQALTDVVVTIGIFKGAQLALDFLMGKGNATLRSQILLSKRKMAQDLQRKALTEALTAEEQAFLAVSKRVTTADYERALASKEVTREQAIMMLALSRGNVQLKNAIVNLGLLTQAEANSVRAGLVLTTVFARIKIAARTMAVAFVQSLPALLAFAAIGGIVQFIQSWNEETERAAALNHKLSENAKEVYDSIGQFLDNYSKSLEKLEKGELVADEQGKLWDAIREEILKSVAEAENYVAELLKIENISDRIKKGRDILDDTERIATILEKVGDQGLLRMGQGEIIGDDAAKDIKEYVEAIDEYIETNGNAIKSFKAVRDIYSNSWKSAREVSWEMDATTQSLSESFNKFRNEILGDDPKKWADNIKQFAAQAQQALLSSDVGKNLSGQQLSFFKIGIDKWVSETISSITNVANFAGGAVERESEIYIAKTLTAWRDFYVSVRLLGKNDRERLLELVKDGKYLQEEYSAEFEILWNKAAEEMRKTARVSYMTIMDDIADLNKQKIIIPVVFRQEEDTRTPLQQQFDEDFQGRQFRFIAPTEKETNLMAYGKRVTKQYKETSDELENAKKQLAEIPEEQSVIYNNQRAYVERLKEELEVEDTIIKAWHLINQEKDKGGKKKDPLLESLKQSIDIIKKAQSEYDTLTQKGASSADALDSVYSNYGRTLKLLNAQLADFNLPQIDLSRLIKGKNPNDILKFFKELSTILESKGLSNLERQKAIEVVIQEFSVKAQTYNLDKITKGLNNELGKLKDEYELAVELDANPELGGMFADLFDIDASTLPHSIDEYAKRVLDALNESFKERGIDFELPTFNLTRGDLKMYEQMVKDKKLDQVTYDLIKKNYEEFYKLRKSAATNVAKMVDEYVREYGRLEEQLEKIEKEKNNKILELNSIYNTAALQQTKEYQDAKFAIEESYRIKSAKAAYDALKKTDEYDRFFNAIDTLSTKDAAEIKAKIKRGIVQAFEDGGLSVSEFRRELKALESQFDKLTEFSSGWMNYLTGGFDKLIQKTKDTGQEIETIGEKIKVTGKVDEKDKNFLNSLGNIFGDGMGGKTNFDSALKKYGTNIKALGGAVSKAGMSMQVGANSFAGALSIIDMIMKGIHQTFQAIDSVINELNASRNEDNKIGNAYWSGIKKFENYTYSGWEKLKSGDIMGSVADVANSYISIFNMFEDRKNEKINAALKESERAVNRLQFAYEALERAVDKAFGTAIIGAQKTAIANKQLQLVELKRQLALEQSRSSKNRDQDKILDLQKQIQALANEIADATDEIVNNLLGISSVGDAAESLMDGFVEALRNGEDAMAAFNEDIDDMIANMVKKMLVSKIIQPWLDAQWQTIQDEINKRGGNLADELADETLKLERARATDTTDKNSLVDALRALGLSEEEIYRLYHYNEDGSYDVGAIGAANRLKAAYEKALKEAEERQAELQKQLAEATAVTLDDVTDYGMLLRSGSDTMQSKIEEVKHILETLDLMKLSGEDTLSNLQQGVQSVTEDTAGAIEGYLNGVSQQVYLHSDLLTQIRDYIAAFDINAQTSIQAQMLLQLQQSYTVQMAIQGILEGWNNPSGQAVRVELIS